MAIVLTGRNPGTTPPSGSDGPAGAAEVTWARPTPANVGLDNPGAVVPASSSTVAGKYKVLGDRYQIIDPGIIEIENEDFSKPIEMVNPAADLRLYNCKTSDFGGGGPLSAAPWNYRVQAVSGSYGCRFSMTSCDFAGAARGILNLNFITHAVVDKSILQKTGADLVKYERSAGYLRMTQSYLTQFADPYYWPEFNTPGDPGHHALVDGTGAPLVHGDGVQAPDIYETMASAISAGVVTEIGGPGNYSPLFEIIGCGFNAIAPDHPGRLYTDDPSPPIGAGAYGGLNGTIFIQNRAGTNTSGSVAYPFFRVIGNWGLGGCANGLQIAAQKPNTSTPAPPTSTGFIVDNNDFAFEYYNAPADIRGAAARMQNNLWSPTGQNMDLWLANGAGWPLYI